MVKEKQIRHRVALDFSPKEIEVLERLKQGSRVSTNSEVVREALKVYGWFLTKKEGGYQIKAVKGKEVTELVLL